MGKYFDEEWPKEEEILRIGLEQSRRHKKERMNKDKIIEELKKVYDPEMPSVDVFNLGLIYDIDIKDEKVEITHTLTSMFCPMADEISKNIKEAGEKVAGVGNVKVIVTHTPPYTRDMLSEEAKLILNL
tara:strand:- start:173 stop:559 length:387 start_codon:yes stop_codon:yes gene_type:complete